MIARTWSTSLLTSLLGALAAIPLVAQPCLDSLPPAARMFHRAVWTGTEMLVWGGTLSPRYDAIGGRLDPVASRWRPMSATGEPAGREAHTVVWTGSEMIVWGGFTDAGDYTDSGGIYDPASDTWRPMPAGPSPRGFHGAVWTGSEMIVWGGADISTYFGDGSRFDPSASNWRPMTPSGAPAARSLHGSAWTGSAMIVWGGLDAAGALGSGALYDPTTDSWTPMATAAAPSPRYFHTVVWAGSDLVVWGGREDAQPVLRDGARYDPASDLWTPMSTTQAPDARSVATGVWTGSEVVIWGGLRDPTGPKQHDTGGRYDPATDSWRATSTTAPPFARCEHTAVWTGSEMIVWGGNNNWAEDAGRTATGGRYDPAADAWQPTPLGPPPGRRLGHTATRAGAEVIVWGRPAPGLRLSIATGMWRGMSALGAHPITSDHTATWTGSDLVLWGGRSLVGVTAAGTHYDLATNSWRSAPAAPLAPRSRHSAVWSGSELLIWGGFDGPGNGLDDGARYDPAAALWTPITSTNAPGPRAGHACAWTGSRMLVWGGTDDVNGWGLGDGAAYDPVQDAWTAMSGAGAPAPRHALASIWSGAELLVWGGRDDGTSATYADGARYDPAADSWTPMAAGPGARSEPATEWTGSAMIVWGGTSLVAGSLQDGARYEPASDTWTAMSMTGDVPSRRCRATATWMGGQLLVAGGVDPGEAHRPPYGAFYDVPSDSWSLCPTGGGCPAIALSPPALPDAVEGSAYAQTIVAAGGTAPHAFTVTAGALPGGLTLAADGVLSGTPSAAGSASFEVTATDANGCRGSRAYTLVVRESVSLPDFVVGQGLGASSPNRVRVVDAAGQTTGVDFFAYGAGAWGVNVAAFQADADDEEEMVTAPGPGEVFGPHVRGFERDGSPRPGVSYYAYGTLRYGANAASGDVDGDGADEILTGPGPGAPFGPHVRGWLVDGRPVTALAHVSFYAFLTLRFGVNVGTGDLQGDGAHDLLAGAGPGPPFAPAVRGFEADATGPVTAMPGLDFFALSTTGHGANVAGGDVDADARDDVAATPGPGPGHLARFVAFAYDGSGVAPIPGFDVTRGATTYGGRVGAGDVSPDVAPRDELLTGAGRDPAASSLVLVYGYASGTLSQLAVSFTPFSGGYGVNVAAGDLDW